jgi:hypothetical protein
MPDAAGIDRFNYRPEVAPKGGEAGKAPEDAVTSSLAQDPLVNP